MLATVPESEFRNYISSRSLPIPCKQSSPELPEFPHVTEVLQFSAWPPTVTGAATAAFVKPLHAPMLATETETLDKVSGQVQDSCPEQHCSNCITPVKQDLHAI